MKAVHALLVDKDVPLKLKDRLRKLLRHNKLDMPDIFNVAEDNAEPADQP